MLHTFIVSGHTDLHNSVANRRILDTLERELPGAEVLRLDALYTNKPIDVPTEQDRLRRADVIVFQFPLFWFNIPSLLQRWMEEVWLHGFSHGTTSHALKGKKLLLSLTTGAPAEVYTPQGADAPDFSAMMQNLCTAAGFTGLEFSGIESTCGVSYALRTDPAQLAAIEAKADAHAQRLIARLQSL